MSVIKTIEQLIRKIDHVVLVLMGENSASQKKLIVPKQFTATELRSSFIKDYVKTQPSLLQVTLLKLYLGMHHLIGDLTRWALRRPRRTSR